MKKIVTIVLAMVFAGAASAQLLNRNINRAGGRPNLARSAATQGGTAATPTAESAEDSDPGGRAIEFAGAPIDLVLKTYGNLVGKTILKDPSAPAASITIQPKKGQELTDEDKILAIETVLEMNGVHLEPYGEKFVRALPRGNVRKEGIPLIMDPEAELGETSKVVSMMLSFQNIALDEAQKALEGLKSDKGVLNVFERTGTILVTDTEMNLNRMREIAKQIDVQTPRTEEVFIRQVRYAAAADIKTALEAIVQESQKELEKQGKQANNAQQSNRGAQSFQPGMQLLRRGPNGGNNQPQQPTSLASVVTSVSDADRGMIRGKVLILSDERSNKLIVITAKSNMDFFDDVIKQLDVETTPDIAVKVYRLKYADAEDVSDMINDLIGNSSSSKSSSRGNQNQNAKSGTGGNMTRQTQTTAKKPANQRSGEAKTGELSKDNTTVLADKRINGLVVMTNKELVPTLEQIIESMDIKLAQVLIETCIIEVTLGNGINFGIDWVQNGRFQGDGGWTTQKQTGSHGLPLYWYKNASGESVETAVYEEGLAPSGWEKIGDALTEGIWKAGELSKDGLVTGSSGYSQMFGGGANNGKVAASIAQGLATNVFGQALNYVFKSDKLNLSAIIQATKTDNRAKYIASPVVMTVDNKEATIEATQARKFLSNYQSNSSGSYYGSSVVPQYENKDIGIKIKVTPKINPNGTVMLEVEEEYSQVGAKQTILDPSSTPVQIETALTRKMSADALLENNQTVILCGLTETQTQESLTGIPWLMDIPWIGKWLFSKLEQSEARSELIIFMTPYVLADGDAAQAEAIRRKKALSDPKPWDDHGWSASPVADPVSKKEQIRRLKDEAKNQDEERKTKLAIEKWKVDRVKDLKKLSKEERDLWLEIHKEELTDEAEKEELEKKMEGKGDDEQMQEELKKLAASVREKRLAEADKEIKSADEEMAAENERAKLDAAKQAKDQMK